MTNPTTTAASSAPDPKKPTSSEWVPSRKEPLPNGGVRQWCYRDLPPKADVKVGDADQGVVEIQKPRPVNVAFPQEQEGRVWMKPRACTYGDCPAGQTTGTGTMHRARKWDVDPADEDFTPADGGWQGLGRETMQASIKAGVDTRNSIRKSSWFKVWSPWIGFALFIGIAVYAYGDDPRRQWWGESNSTTDRRSPSEMWGATGGGRGTNESAKVLAKWQNSPTWKRLRLEEQDEAQQALRKDRK